MILTLAFPFFGVFIALLFAVWLCLAGRGITRQLKRGSRINWLVAVAGFFVMVGGGGFAASALSAMGIIPLPDSFEWPPGYVRGITEAFDGNYVVPLVPAGRLQIYDSQWHFIRGWHIDASGGDFTVACSPNDEILVFTGRGRRRYTFTETGKLISATLLPESFVFPEPGQYIEVPTSRLLWIFSSPFLSWGLVLIGALGLWVANKFSPGKRQPNSNQTV